jgi:tetratricopeptide (TPR) repeat protein
MRTMRRVNAVANAPMTWNNSADRIFRVASDLRSGAVRAQIVLFRSCLLLCGFGIVVFAVFGSAVNGAGGRVDVPDDDGRLSEAAAGADEADSLRRQHRYADAERCGRRAIALDPRLPRAHSVLGRVFLETGRYEEAEAAFREAVQLDPGSGAAHRNLASVVQARKRGSWLKYLPMTRRPHR